MWKENFYSVLVPISIGNSITSTSGSMSSGVEVATSGSGVTSGVLVATSSVDVASSSTGVNVK